MKKRKEKQEMRLYQALSTQTYERLHMTWKGLAINAQEVEFINSHERNTGNYINADT